MCKGGDGVVRVVVVVVVGLAVDGTTVLQMATERRSFVPVWLLYHHSHI